MIRPVPLLQELAECRDKSLVGGKAINLGQLIRAGFPVPEGFVITTEAYRRFRTMDLQQGTNLLADEIKSSWRKLGAVAVAVRSSATAEDMSEASMAGQYDTFLDIADEQALLSAVVKCWASLSSARTRTYLAEHGIDLAQVAMAVVVQRLVPADVAGVMFGANPQTGSRDEMLIEASWGLGESVVSGRVQPDVLLIDRASGNVIRQTISDKQIYIRPGEHEEKPVEPERRRAACLGNGDVTRLWRLGRRAEEYFGQPQDIEWAILQGELHLLQSRAITTLEDAAVFEELVHGTRSRLRSQLEGGRGPWVLHNISETLKHPTPLTWSVIRRFMSGSGGFGAMYRLAGFEPSGRVSAEGFLERIGGRVYMDGALAPEMFAEGFPFRYDVDLLRNNPDAGQSPPTLPCGGLRARLKANRLIGRADATMRELAADFDKKLTERIIPDFVEWCRQEKSRDLSQVSSGELIRLWRERQRRVMDEFAPQSLLPSLISGMALADLRNFIQENFWDEDADALANMLSASLLANRTIQANADLYELAQGRWNVDQWLALYGHRAADEFDLATPRWRERRQELAVLVGRLRSGADPLEMHRHHVALAQKKLDALSAMLSHSDALALHNRAAMARRYIIFRENGKYYLMLGYDLLRDLALEAARRLSIGEDVFQLTDEELFDSLRLGFAPSRLIAQRKTLYEAEAKLSLPAVIDSAALDNIGQPPTLSTAASHSGFAVSSGVATGPARIVHSPEQAGDLGSGYILVCPSTDPGWTPLFVNAAGLVLECGGTLSHGAVVAREMNIPAVVLSGATRLFRDGETITVDGRNGSIGRAEELRTAPENETSPDDVRVAPQLLPPLPGKIERRSAKLRNWAALIWGVYLAAVFLLPQKCLYDPTIAAFDAVFWPLLRNAGKAVTVVVIAVLMAVVTMGLQLLLTDNRRLREAKRRAGLLTKEALQYPKGSRRRMALLNLGLPVQMRVVGASFVPLALILGPMVMSFVWLPQRVDPAVVSMPADSTIDVIATVDGEYLEPILIGLAEPLRLAPTFEPSVRVRPIRQRLEAWYKDLDKLTDDPGAIGTAAKIGQQNLKETLSRPIPPQQCLWKLRNGSGESGKYPVIIRPASGAPVHVDIVLGNKYPPGAASVLPDGKSPIHSVEVKYTSPSKEKPHFWNPVKSKPDWDPGWLLTYLVVYIPAMFATKWTLRVV